MKMPEKAYRGILEYLFADPAERDAIEADIFLRNHEAQIAADTDSETHHTGDTSETDHTKDHDHTPGNDCDYATNGGDSAHGT